MNDQPPAEPDLQPLDKGVSLHQAGLTPPDLPAQAIPAHVACIMDGNGRWANARGLARSEGHRAGEATMMDVIAGAVEIGIKELSVYAFSTENWRRSPAEVRFLMGFTRQVLRAQTDDLLAWGVRVNWVGREPRLWKSVLTEVRRSERITSENTTLTLNMCLNYGGRAEIADAARRIARDAVDGRLKPGAVTERTVRRYLYSPDMGDVDLFIRTGGEQRTSNFLMWESAYAELYFSDVAWPDFDRRELWRACQAYAERDRRFGGAVDAVASQTATPDGSGQTGPKPGEEPNPGSEDREDPTPRGGASR